MERSIIIALCIVASLGFLHAESVAKAQRTGFVYILREDVGPYHKVGITNDVDRRVRDLQTGNPRKLHVVYKKEVNDVSKAETAAKEAAKDFKVSASMQGGTEWYNVPANQYNAFENAIEHAINAYATAEKAVLMSRLMEKAITQLLNME